MGIHDDETIIAGKQEVNLKKTVKKSANKTTPGKSKQKKPVLKYQLQTGLRKTPYPLDKRIRLTIGRGTSCRVRITEKTISELHASIKWNKGAFRLKDEKSTNGTFLNGKEVRRELKLADGDKIKIGRNVLVFNIVKS
jgi:pSer/pThr/pTyr-binding forkhead associated (FHA) protein